jgi:hypothetical protein
MSENKMGEVLTSPPPLNLSPSDFFLEPSSTASSESRHTQKKGQPEEKKLSFADPQ